MDQQRRVERIRFFRLRIEYVILRFRLHGLACGANWLGIDHSHRWLMGRHMWATFTFEYDHG